MKPEYSVHIFWSDDDQAYLADIQELPGCVSDGATPEEALQNAREMAKEWIETAKADNRPVPPPRTLGDIEKGHVVFQEHMKQFMSDSIQQAVSEIIGKLQEQEEQPLTRSMTIFGFNRCGITLTAKGQLSPQNSKRGLTPLLPSQG